MYYHPHAHVFMCTLSPTHIWTPYAYIIIHSYMHSYTHTHSHMYTLCIYPNIRINLYTCTHCKCIITHMYVYSRTHVCVCIYILLPYESKGNCGLDMYLSISINVKYILQHLQLQAITRMLQCNRFLIHIIIILPITK